MDSWTGFWKPQDESDCTPVFSALPGQRKSARLPRVEPVSTADARCITEYAESRYGSLGARVEFSRSKGVDYERTKSYLGVVESLEESFLTDGMRASYPRTDAGAEARRREAESEAEEGDHFGYWPYES